MRESIGATWIFGIVISFIALFSGFLAFSINYSKAFAMKDGVIDRIEKYNGFSKCQGTCGLNNRKTYEDINSFMDEIGYASRGVCSVVASQGDFSSFPVLGVDRSGANKAQDRISYNYCVQRISNNPSDGTLSSVYYKVYVFFGLSLPFLGESSVFSINGDTVALYFPDESGVTFR